MRQILATTDDVLIATVTSLLAADGIECLVLDRHMSTMEGSIGIFPRRVLVPDDDYDEARGLLVAAGLEQDLA